MRSWTQRLAGPGETPSAEQPINDDSETKHDDEENCSQPGERPTEGRTEAGEKEGKSSGTEYGTTG